MAQWVRMLATQREDLDSDLQQPRRSPGAAIYHNLHHYWKGYRYKVHRGVLATQPSPVSARDPAAKAYGRKY